MNESSGGGRMSGVSGFFNRNKGRAGTLAGVAVAVAGIGVALYHDTWPTIVPAQNFGVRIRNGQLVSDKLEPNLYWVRPVLDNVYSFPNNTTIINGTAGNSRNASDQNSISADYRIHYRVNPKAGYLALHIETMARDGGVELVGGLTGQAVDTAAGNRRAVDTLNDPSGFLKTMVTNLQWRLKQNNVPVDIDTVELLTLHSGGTRMPVQLRLRPGSEVEAMSAVGPGAVPVPQAKPAP